jgi:cold shock CspA family protein
VSEAGPRTLLTGGGALYGGVVAAFDEAAGLGRVQLDEGSLVDFHCTAVVDGSRVAHVGARVHVTLAPGHGGAPAVWRLEERGLQGEGDGAGPRR